MRNVLRWAWAPAVAAGILIVGLSSPFWAGGQPKDTKALDKTLNATLKDVINHGAGLFNKYRDHNGCYRVFDGALRTARPLLGHHPDLQKAIDAGLAEAEQLPSVTDRAFALRKVLDGVRAKLGPPDVPTKDKDKKVEPKDKDKKIEPKDKKIEPKDKDKKVEPKATLWKRLGGEGNVRKVVDEFVATAGADPKVNVTRDGKYKLDDEAVKGLKQKLVEFVSAGTGGPLKYTGKSMKEAHKGMMITDAEFNAAGGHFKKALEKFGAKPADVDATMKILGGTRKDIVEVPKKKKKVDDKKKEDEKKQPPNTAKVFGKVTFTNGQPAPAGYLTFVGEDKSKVSTYIFPDGTYSFKAFLPRGMYKVTIEPGLKDDPLTVKNVPIPALYRNPATSPLQVEVLTGTQRYDIQLEPKKGT